MSPTNSHVLVILHRYLAIWGLCDKHSPWVLNHTSLGMTDSAWWIFLGKKGGVVPEVTLMWATFIKPCSRGSCWNWKVKKVVILGWLQVSRGTERGKGNKTNKQLSCRVVCKLTDWSGQCMFTCCGLQSAHSSKLPQNLPRAAHACHSGNNRCTFIHYEKHIRMNWRVDFV